MSLSKDRQEQDGDFQQLPSTCTGGVLRLAGKYKVPTESALGFLGRVLGHHDMRWQVTREVKFDEDCDVQGDSPGLCHRGLLWSEMGRECSCSSYGPTVWHPAPTSCT